MHGQAKLNGSQADEINALSAIIDCKIRDPRTGCDPSP
jgi:hypothetical protein